MPQGPVFQRGVQIFDRLRSKGFKKKGRARRVTTVRRQQRRRRQ